MGTYRSWKMARYGDLGAVNSISIRDGMDRWRVTVESAIPPASKLSCCGVGIDSFRHPATLVVASFFPPLALCSIAIQAKRCHPHDKDRLWQSPLTFLSTYLPCLLTGCWTSTGWKASGDRTRTSRMPNKSLSRPWPSLTTTYGSTETKRFSMSSSKLLAPIVNTLQD